MGWFFGREKASEAQVTLEKLQAQSTPDARDEATIDSRSGVTGSFSMPIEDVFSITGRGTVVTGEVAVGTVRVGQTVVVARPDGSRSAPIEVTGIESRRRKHESAAAGQSIGVLLRGVSRTDVSRGDTLTF